MNSVTVLSLFLCCGAAAAGVRYAHYRIKTRRGLLRAWESKRDTQMICMLSIYKPTFSHVSFFVYIEIVTESRGS